MRVGRGVVKTELAIASEGPETIPAASCWSVLPLGDGKSDFVGVDAARTASWMPLSLGTLATGSDGATSLLLPPPHPARISPRTARRATIGVAVRNMGEARLVADYAIRRERLDHGTGVEGVRVALAVDEEHRRRGEPGRAGRVRVAGHAGGV